MKPNTGGDPLPPSPICLPREYQKAAAYVKVLTEALTLPGWSKGQRQKIRQKLRLWAFRAEGRDPQFELYGSFGRAPGTAPPTTVDAVVEKWRRLRVQSEGERAARKTPWRLKERMRDRDRFGW